MWVKSFTTTDALVAPMVIFNNNKGNQTADLVLVNNGIYKFSGKTGEMSGIDTIISSDTDIVEYYTLQGVRVEKPEKGIYIKKQGSRITKVVL